MPDPRPRVTWLPGAVCLAALLCASFATAQPAPEPPAALQFELQAAQDALARGVAEFEGPQQSRSIVVFDEVINRLETIGARSLPARGKDILAQAYEYRGRAYYGIGLPEKASENFRQLVQLKPDHALSKERVSPKIVELFDSVKRTLVGFIAVSSEPAGAQVTLVSPSGERTDLGLTDFFPIEVLAAEYAVEVARPGYRTETRAVSIAAEATETLAVPLERVLASAFLIVEPTGVEIWVDGELRATAAGNLAPELHEAARASGLDPNRAAARVELTNLSLGSHVVELRRRCYAGVKRTLETPLAQDYALAPIRLEDSLASLKLTSDPPGARILLNGEARGVTPSQIEGICSGKVRVEVKHAAGKFIKDLVLEKDESVSLDCPIRPTLAFLGVEAASAAGLRNVADAEEKIQQNLQARISSLNFIAAPREAVDRMLEQERLTRQSLLPGAETDPDLVRKVTGKMADSLEVQGFLLALLPDERLQRTARLHLLAAGSTTAEAVDLLFGDGPAYAPLVARIDTVFAAVRPWSGLVTVDTLLHEGVPVLRVVEGSPAALAGVKPGELVSGADGQPVKRTADLLAAVAAKKPGERLVLQLRGAAASPPRGVELTLAASAREVPLFDPQLLYNKVMMDLRAVVEGYPGSEQAAYAWLNLAICALHFSDYAGAHGYLQKAQAELPQRPGLSRGTALYYFGLALEKLGYRPQAIDAYRSAAEAKDATLIDNDGPAVAALAARRAAP